MVVPKAMPSAGAMLSCVFKRDALSIHVLAQAVKICARFARYLVQLRQRCAFGLRIHPTRTRGGSQAAGRLFASASSVSSARPCGSCHHRRKNGDAFLATLDPAAKLVPCPHARHVRGLWLLSRYQQNIAKTVVPGKWAIASRNAVSVSL
jgi:hypothetical protein